MRSIFPILSTAFFFVACLVACAQEPTPNADGSYGASFKKGEPMSVAAAMSKVEKEGGAADIQIEGEVTSVCQVKGCWMNVKDDKSGQEMFVKFKDYGFFMPKDLAGKRVVMKGNAYTETMTVEDLRHFAEDEGKSKEEIEAITEPEQSINFLADGVIIL